MPNNNPIHPAISQTELAALFELGEARDAWAISIRHRLAAGVPIEPGTYVADCDDSGIAAYEAGACTGTGTCGLFIQKRETVKGRARG